MKRKLLIVLVIALALMLSFCERKAEISPERFKVLADTLAQEMDYEPWMDFALELATNYPEEYVAGMVMMQAAERSIMEEDAQRFSEFIELLNNYPEHGALEMQDQIAISNQLAWIMTSQGLLAAQAQGVIESGISKFKVHEENIQYQNELGAAIYSTQGRVYENLSETDKALASYNQAIEYMEQPEILMSRGLLLEEKGELGDALEDYVTALGLAPNQVLLSSKVKEVYARMYPDQDVNLFYQDLQESLQERRREEVLSESFSIEAPNFKFTDFDGNTLDNENMMGKVVFVDFWATWCGPCRRELPEFQAFYELYKGNPNVAFIAASTDQEKEKVKPYIAQANFTFPVAYDEGNAMKFGVEGIPSLFIIGPSGKMRYKIVGYDPDKDFVKEMTWRMESLLDS